MEPLDKNLRMNELLDAYKTLLTTKQQEILKLYYEEDFSLSEIGEILKISRAAVSDHLKRSEKALTDYEERLQLVAANKRRSKLYDAMRGMKNKQLDQFIKALEAIEGVTEAKVSHEEGNAVVDFAGDVSDEALKKAVEDQDYSVVSIEVSGN